MEKMIRSTEKPYSCDVCEKAFDKKSALANHNRIHTGEKPFECDICTKTFNQSSSLALHKRIHAGVKEYECDICEKKFMTKHHLETHKRTHTGEKPFLCEICLKSFTDLAALSKHKKSAAHLKRLNIDQNEETRDEINIKKFKLEFNESEIKTNIHGEKSYSINSCEAVNYTERDINNVNTGSKPYQCDVCLKTFNQKHHLKGHKLSHSGERPYSCDICGKDFSRKESVTRHKKVHIFQTRKKNVKNTISSKNFRGDFCESIKVDDIKEEIGEEESVENTYCKASGILIKAEDIECEIKEEKSVKELCSIKQENIVDFNSDINEDMKEEISDE